ncbi:hypothetical protein Y1Q_0019608 [Alligator mississippiensis]|uniref:Uncharacterized protein n=1 Tax=Alligator mississippiensis TaxID=8496 RepID=A0A151PER7_ALLMI|nr:hypothetical protein Y1Q_0019608 [Alligator mississippiensis]
MNNGGDAANVGQLVILPYSITVTTLWTCPLQPKNILAKCVFEAISQACCIQRVLQLFLPQKSAPLLGALFSPATVGHFQCSTSK